LGAAAAEQLCIRNLENNKNTARLYKIEPTRSFFVDGVDWMEKPLVHID